MLNASLTGSKWLSGGTAGPEASVFDLVVTIAGILLLARIYPEAKYPVLALSDVPVDGLPAAPAETVMPGSATGNGPQFNVRVRNANEYAGASAQRRRANADARGPG